MRSREFSTALVTLHVLGQEYSTDLGILELSQEFSKDLRLRKTQPVSEEEVLHELRRVFSTTFTVIHELRRGNLRLRGAQLSLELHVKQVFRRRIQEMESERVAGFQIAITPQGLRSTLSTYTSIYAQPMVLPDLDTCRENI